MFDIWFDNLTSIKTCNMRFIQIKKKKCNTRNLDEEKLFNFDEAFDIENLINFVKE